MIKTNPTIKEFLKDKPELTIMGLFWAGLWRFWAFYFAVVIFFFLLVDILD